VRKFISALFLTAICGDVLAEWDKVASGANSTGYVDRASIRKSDTSVTMQVLIDYQKPPFDGNNLPYLSLTMRNEYHCSNRQFRVLLITSHTGNMGNGAQPYKTDEPSEWETVPSTSIQKAFWEIACGKKSTGKTKRRNGQ
jgi:hypothetical protein